MAQLIRIKGSKVEVLKTIAPFWKKLGFLMDLDPKGRKLHALRQRIHIRAMVNSSAVKKSSNNGWKNQMPPGENVVQKDLAKQIENALDL